MISMRANQTTHETTRGRLYLQAHRPRPTVLVQISIAPLEDEELEKFSNDVA